MKKGMVLMSIALMTIGGLFVLLGGLVLGFALMAVGFIMLVLALFARREDAIEWRALSEMTPEHARHVMGAAQRFARFDRIENVIYPRVPFSHTRTVDVLGVDRDGERVLIGVEPENCEVVKMVRLCPRKDADAVAVTLTMDEAAARCDEFLRKRGLSLPDDYVLDEAHTTALGPWQRWRLVWRHARDGVRVLPDFVTMEVNADERADVISYSKVDHGIDVSLRPELPMEQALARAINVMPALGELDLEESQLAVTYPNHFFQKHDWVWSDDQALCWILGFERAGRHALDVWVDASSGAIVGGEFCHLHSPRVYGIDAVGDTHMKAHVDNVWSPYLDMMKFDVSGFSCTNTAAGVPESTISNAIASSRYFVVEGHGDVTATAEMMAIAYQGSTDARQFTPDEVPANDLRFVLLDTCQSGEDGTGLDFKDTFISQGADVFIGFDAYMCAWAYEDRLLYYLAGGLHLANAHDLAKADVSPSYPIVITYNVACLNKVRLAPLQVSVMRSPAGDLAQGSTFTVQTTVDNREDVDYTVANNVQANLVLPAGFSIVSGANPQTLGNLGWHTPTTATWTVRCPITPGTRELDVEVWSDNLGTAVADPTDPFHKFDVNVVSHFHLARIRAYEMLRRWFGWMDPRQVVDLEHTGQG